MDSDQAHGTTNSRAMHLSMRACSRALRMGARSVKRNSSCRLLGMRWLRSASVQLNLSAVSLRKPAQSPEWLRRVGG